jgi:hypothetical protein
MILVPFCGFHQRMKASENVPVFIGPNALWSSPSSRFAALLVSFCLPLFIGPRINRCQFDALGASIMSSDILFWHCTLWVVDFVRSMPSYGQGCAAIHFSVERDLVTYPRD